MKELMEKYEKQAYKKMEKITEDYKTKLNIKEREYDELRDQFKIACETGVALKEKLNKAEEELSDLKEEVKQSMT